MMRQMRDNMKLIMAITAIAFVGLMVFTWGMDISGRSANQMTGGEIGRVNGEPVTLQEWQATYQNLVNQEQQAAPGPLTISMQRQLEDAAWNQVVVTKLVNQELRRRGIEVSDNEVRTAARYAPPPEFMTNPAFQTDGQFDISKYHQFLSSPGVDPQLLWQLEAYYRELIPRSKLLFQTTSGAYVSDSELWRLYRDATETAKVRYILIDPSTAVPDNKVTVTDREIQDFYRKNKDDFIRPARAQVRYIMVDNQPTAADTAAARQRAADVRRQLAAGADFGEVARANSADSVSARQGGDLGKIFRGQTVPAFDQAAFSQPIGRVGEPVQSQFGFHIIEVKSRNADTADVRHILIPIERSPEAEDRLLARIDSIDAAGESGSLDRVAQQFELQVRTAELNPAFPFLPVVGQADDGAVWAFEEGAVGEVSEVFENQNAFYMLELVSRTEEGTMSLQEATPSIRTGLMERKKLEEAKVIGRQVLDRIRSGATLEQAAAASNLQVQEAGPFTRVEFVPGLGRANAAIGTAFGLKPGQVGPLVEAEGGVFIIQLIEKTEASREEFEQAKAEQRSRVAQALAEQRWNQFMAALRDEAKIVDNRAEVLRPAPAN